MASTQLLFISILMLWYCTPVAAQNPLSDVGGWPSGAVLLLGGLYAAIQASSRDYFDVLPPVCVSTLWHRVPIVKKWLRGWKAGAYFAAIILENSPDSRPVRFEWDRVICPAPRRADEEAQGNNVRIISNRGPGGAIRDAPIESEVFRISAASHGDSPEVSIRILASSVNADHLEQATAMLYDHLSISDDGIHSLLMKWRGLVAYRKKQARWAGSKAPSQDKLQSCVDGLVKHVLTGEKDDALEERLGYLKQFQVQISMADTGHWWGLAKINACELSAMRAFSILLSKPPHTADDMDLNPLLPCLQLWRKGMLQRSDCLHITLPPDDVFKLQLTENDGPQETQFNTLSYDLELQKGPYYVDGLSSSNYMGPSLTLWHVSWLVNLFSACVLAFFVTVASNASPSLATALALTFAAPHTNDYTARDAGSPPAWNGRVRIRWGDGYASGLFCGPYRGYPGSTGSSAPRCCAVLAVSWATWARRLQLRRLLEFEPDRPVARWVKWVAVGGLLCVGPLIFLFVCSQRNKGFGRKLVPLLLLGAAGCVLGSSLVAWMVARGLETWWLTLVASEGGVLVLGSLLSAIVFTGIPRRNGMLMSSTDVFWVALVLTSCLNG